MVILVLALDYNIMYIEQFIVIRNTQLHRHIMTICRVFNFIVFPLLCKNLSQPIHLVSSRLPIHLAPLWLLYCLTSAVFFQEILKTVELNEAWELLPSMWSDLITFDQSNREPSVRLMLSALRASLTTDAKLSEQLANVAWDIWTRVNGQPEDRVNKIRLVSQTLGYSI